MYKIEDLVREILEAHKKVDEPLARYLPKFITEEDLRNEQDQVCLWMLDDISRMWMSAIKEADPEMYGYIPSDSAFVYNVLSTVVKHRTGGKRFIDAGCGIGIVNLMASYLGYVSHGLELDDRTFNLAQTLFGEKCTFIKGSVVEYDYGDYDVIYSYRPYRNKRKQDEFVGVVEGSMRVGSLFINVDAAIELAVENINGVIVRQSLGSYIKNLLSG
ncbi:MAG: class I SAM-dependent methyltransferase [bacterium]|nr:class I SAM-dependent methyltransferase [bacterium]